MAAAFVVPMYIASLEGEPKTIQVLDETGVYYNKFTGSATIKFKHVYKDIYSQKEIFRNSDDYALLYIPKTDISIPNSAYLYAKTQAGLNVITLIKTSMEKELELLKLNASGIDPDILDSVQSEINLISYKIDDEGSETKGNTQLSMIVGWVCSLLIYFFIFSYGSQVMRGVIEEKNSRIVEIIVSSVRPIKLMAGKIVGIGLVGLTQFILWTGLTFLLVSGFSLYFSEDISRLENHGFSMEQSIIGNAQQADENELNNLQLLAVWDGIHSVNYGVILISFLFFFIAGYLLYAALFAAIGSAVDAESDTQQFMIPLTVPLIIALVSIPYVIYNPENSAVIWLSMIPFTSPVSMMARIPFGIPILEIFLSAFILILGFVITLWFAAKIYRTGILMYGKKINYKELWKWLTYKNN